MKRSEINAVIRDAEQFISSCGFKLPPLAGWTPEDWRRRQGDTDIVRAAGLGWDITDFGKGDFQREGLVLFTLRNGLPPGVGGESLPYAEKILVARENQITLTHYHRVKTEDLIVRAGAPLAVRLNMLTSEGGLDMVTPVRFRMDGLRGEVGAGGTVIVEAGASLTLEPYCAHSFWGHGGKTLIGEVSSVNDDMADNVFFENTARFPDIEENEPPYRLIVPDYLSG